MKIAFYIISILLLNSCGIKQETNQGEINNEAKELNDQAIGLIRWNNQDSLQLAKDYLNEAIKIQPNYFLAYRNKSLVLNQMGLTKELIENLQTLARLQPKNPDNFSSLGLMMELNGDGLHAMEKYQIADSLYVSILDTLTVETDPQYSMATNRALNLKYLHKETEANELLLKLKTDLQEPFMKEMIDDFIKMSRNELLERLK